MTMRPIQRAAPTLPVQRMQTYRVASPVQTHTRPATCDEVGCKQYLNGWITFLPVGDPKIELLKQACRGEVDGYRRHFAETTGLGDPIAEFRFNAGQMCFQVTKHRKSLQRPEFYLVRGGDWRANTGLIRRHTKPEFWVEDFAENQDKIARQVNG